MSFGTYRNLDELNEGINRLKPVYANEKGIFIDLETTLFREKMLRGNYPHSINIDTALWDRENQKVIFIEFLGLKKQSPHKCLKDKYFEEYRPKYLFYWNTIIDIRNGGKNADFYLVKYPKMGNKFSNEILVQKVLNIDENLDNPIVTNDNECNIESFSKWFCQLNERGSKTRILKK